MSEEQSRDVLWSMENDASIQSERDEDQRRELSSAASLLTLCGQGNFLRASLPYLSELVR